MPTTRYLLHVWFGLSQLVFSYGCGNLEFLGSCIAECSNPPNLPSSPSLDLTDLLRYVYIFMRQKKTIPTFFFTNFRLTIEHLYVVQKRRSPIFAALNSREVRTYFHTFIAYDFFILELIDSARLSVSQLLEPRNPSIVVSEVHKIRGL